MRDTEVLNRWRLILGKNAGGQLSFEDGAALENGISCFDLEEALDFLYSREVGGDVRREGGTGASCLTAATWITKIRKLFPKETVEILERHALERYQLKELLADKEILERLEPNQELLKTILHLKHLMKGEVLETARRIVRKVAEAAWKEAVCRIRAPFGDSTCSCPSRSVCRHLIAAILYLKL